MSNVRTLLKAAGFTLFTELAFYICARICRRAGLGRHRQSLSFALKSLYDVPHDQNFNKVIFFPDPGLACRRVLSGRQCRDAHCPAIHREKTSLNVLISILNLARVSVDVCVYMITCGILGDVLVECQRRGIKLRVLTEERNSGEEGEMTGSQIGKLRSAAIDVRCQVSSFWMHHKFCIVDNEILINGSFNWTNQAVMGNSENLIITDEPALVHPFMEEFQKLWNKLDPKEYFDNKETCNSFLNE